MYEIFNFFIASKDFMPIKLRLGSFPVFCRCFVKNEIGHIGSLSSSAFWI